MADLSNSQQTGESSGKDIGDSEDIVEEPTTEHEPSGFWQGTFAQVYHHTLPNWLRDNDLILRWHRPPMPSAVACFKSMFQMHSETINIWTHLFGCITFAILAIYFFIRPPSMMCLMDKMMFGLFFATSVLCMGLSCTYHILLCHSRPVVEFLRKLDYCGIAALIMGSIIPWLHYCFYDDIMAEIFYLSVSVLLGLACVFVSMSDTFSAPSYRAHRFGLFSLFAFSGVIPLAHYVIIEGLSSIYSMTWLLLSLAVYALGGAIYSTRIPERCSPGMFDIFFQSHQIFHVLVIAAAFFHYFGMHDIATIRLAKQMSDVK